MTGSALQVGAQGEYPHDRGLEAGLRGGIGREEVTAQRIPRVDSLVRVLCRAEQQVHTGLGGQGRALAGRAEVLQRSRLEAIGDGDAGESKTFAQLALDDR